MEGAIYYVCSAPPSIHSSSEAKLEAEKGQNVKMYCKGNGSPKPTVKWTRVVGLYELCKTDLPYEQDVAGKDSVYDGKADMVLYGAGQGFST